MKKIKNKRQLLAIIADSALDEKERRELLTEMIKNGEITENDVAEMMIEDIDRNREKFEEVFRTDEMVQFLLERFRDKPSYLARALVRARPDIFYSYGFAFRLVIKLRADLGEVEIPPRTGGGGGRPDITPIDNLPDEVQRDIVALDVECRFREFLFFFSRDFEIGMTLLQEQIDIAPTTYDKRILKEAAKIARRLASMKLDGVVSKVNGQPFPALHVRWWLDLSGDKQRMLNMGDTGTYKSSYAAIAMRRAGCERILILCAAHARDNWYRELASYFTMKPKVQVIRCGRDLKSLDPAAEFTVVAYSSLINGNVDKLLKGEFDGLIQDESHYGNNVEGAQRAIACHTLSSKLKLKKYVALSATPWENHPEELGAIAVALRPDLFVTPEVFITSGAARSPRLMRELFSDNILDIELREVKDLPEITPKPWDDLFGAKAIKMNSRHGAVYEHVYNDTTLVSPSEKARRLLMAAIHPHMLLDRCPWTQDGFDSIFNDWSTSSKLAWIKKFVDEHHGDHKVVVATGMYTEGVTQLPDGSRQTFTVASLFKKWYGEDAVLVLDGHVRLKAAEGEMSQRDQVIRRWRTDPNARILVISKRACPDSVNLSIGPLPGIKGLAITSLSLGWKPWKQFLGRFWREGQAVPVKYCNPVLEETIDDNLLGLNQDKWRAQQLFRALAPLTDGERSVLRREGAEALKGLMRDAVDHVNIISSMMSGRGEKGCRDIYNQHYGTKTNAQLYAEHFLATQDRSTPGNIARYMTRHILKLAEIGLVDTANILDAGCGPLTLERYVNAPLFSIDMNQTMIDLGKNVSPHGGVNARVGYISKMPAEWTGKFQVVASSLVLDMTSLSNQVRGLPERLFILKELSRVCDPNGFIWLTWNISSQTDETLRNWKAGLNKAGFHVIEDLSGLVRSTDKPDHKFEFWSLAFRPTEQGKIKFGSPDDFKFAFEFARRRRKTGGKGRPPVASNGGVGHSEFEVVRNGGSVSDQQATIRVVSSELERLAGQNFVGLGKLNQDKILELLGNNWRILEALRKLGVYKS